MDKNSFYLLFTFLLLGYWIIRSMGRSEEPKEEAKPPMAPPSLQAPCSPPKLRAVQPPPSKNLLKKIKKDEPRYPKNSRASQLRKFAKKGKDWVVLSELLKKKFDF